MSDTDDTFPRQYARTQRLSLGEPRAITVSPDGQRVAFVRAPSSDDPVHSLWLHDVAAGTDRLVADPREVLGGDEGDLPPEERARRERVREGGAGVVAFATDRDVRVAAFALGGELWVAGLLSGRARRLGVPGPVVDPRPDPGAQRVAYVHRGGLWVGELDGSHRCLVNDLDPSVTWGLADFAAAEEMGRSRGYWWSPDGRHLAVARVDTTDVPVWWIGDPANPGSEPVEHRYPAAGTTNADVQLAVVTLDGSVQMVRWDHTEFPYLVDVAWRDADTVTVMVQSRDQRTVRWLDASVGGDGPDTVCLVFEDTDDTWVEIVPGGWGRLASGAFVCCADRDGARRILVDGVAVTPAHRQVRSITRIGDDSIVFVANELDEPSETHLWRWSPSGLEQLSDDHGVHSGAANGPTVVLRRASLDELRASFTVITPDGRHQLDSNTAEPLVQPFVHLLRLGERRLQAALLLPRDVRDDQRLPVLLDPYGGPHAQRVVASAVAHATSQWFADQGFAVLVVDGRGTPGRGSAWERSVHHDLTEVVLQDQIDALDAAAAGDPRLDLDRVAIRGWSFGGYLAALAVLDRPDRVHAAIAGAPVTEWRLYDTHYTERYLGHPGHDPAPYDACSLLPRAARLERPLMIVHGLADDNVVAAHSLQLSGALLEAGRPHEFLPLAGVTHMTPQEVVAENLLLLQLAFLRRSLGLDGG